jgi:DUF1680 family protein
MSTPIHQPKRPADVATATADTPGPIALSDTSPARLRPASSAAITGGFWQGWRERNARVSIPAGADQLEQAGNLHNLRFAAGQTSGAYRGDLPFLDSDVHKWLEAVAWQLGDRSGVPAQTDDLTDRLDRIVGLLAAAQEPDGYLQSYFQVHTPGVRYADLAWGHELYCAGHLIQAAVALARTTGRDDLLTIARRFADRIDADLGPDGRVAIDGHPNIETALVELYRQTDEPRYLKLAGCFLDRRGRGLLGDCRFGRTYWQDQTPIRQAAVATGHAVRQVYLLAGAVDVYLETGDAELLTAAERVWADMAATKTYLTGGMGSHHEDEAFGDPYELPSERGYCETCAAIGSVMLSWRLLLATGRSRYADLIERTLYNGFLAGVSLDGGAFRYVNPLHVRDGHAGTSGDHGARRTPWFRCACCPPNVMRLLASLPHYVCVQRPGELALHQYATGDYGGDDLAVRVRTDYPWAGRIEVELSRCPDQPATVRLRVPSWCEVFELSVNGRRREIEPADGWLRLEQAWQVGDIVVLELDMPARLTAPHPRMDAIRGCLALERGPLVYCLEQDDQPRTVVLDDLLLEPSAGLTTRARPELLGGVTSILAVARQRATDSRTPADWWSYAAPRPSSASDTTVEVTAIPFDAWANRTAGSVRVWLPCAPAQTAAGQT